MKPVTSKLEANWRQKSLERLEKSEWPAPDVNSGIVERAHRLRKIPVGDLTADELRFLLVQQMGFPYTLESALGLLREDLFIEAGYYNGDLLHAILKVKQETWDVFPSFFNELVSLIRPQIGALRAFRPRLPLDHMIGPDKE